MGFKDLEKTLSGLMDDLKPAAFEPENADGCWLEELDGTEKDNSKWLSYMTEWLKTADAFEIHCWNEETEWIDRALLYGSLKETDWRHGKIIAGAVTPEFVSMLLNVPKPADTEIYNKMTPFFTVHLDNGFESAHYGTELIAVGKK